MPDTRTPTGHAHGNGTGDPPLAGAVLTGRRGRAARRAIDRYGIVLLLLLVTYALASVLPETSASIAFIVAVQAVTVIVTLAASRAAYRTRRTVAAMAAVAIVCGASSAAAGGTGLGIALLISALLLVVALLSILRRVAGHDRVTVQTILGAIDSYVLLGLIYSFAYGAIGRIGSGSFFGSSGHETLSNYLFFSFTTLTTTGYGNLIPANQVGQTAATFEMLMGQIYLVTVVARLVALWRRRDD